MINRFGGHHPYKNAPPTTEQNTALTEPLTPLAINKQMKMSFTKTHSFPQVPTTSVPVTTEIKAPVTAKSSQQGKPEITPSTNVELIPSMISKPQVTVSNKGK